MSDLNSLSTETTEQLPEVIDNLEELLGKFGLSLDQVNLFNKYLYKGTTCGASISIQTLDGVWHHNGDDWTGITEATSFTIQTIVEGSDITVDSDPFIFPVSMKAIDQWLEYMEGEARRIWESANYEHYYLKVEGEMVGTVVLTWDGAEVESLSKDATLPIEELKQLVSERTQDEYPETMELPPINEVAYFLEKYEPEEEYGI